MGNKSSTTTDFWGELESVLITGIKVALRFLEDAEEGKLGVDPTFLSKLKQDVDVLIAGVKGKWDGSKLNFGYQNNGASSRPPRLYKGGKVLDISNDSNFFSIDAFTQAVSDYFQGQITTLTNNGYECEDALTELSGSVQDAISSSRGLEEFNYYRISTEFGHKTAGRMGSVEGVVYYYRWKDPNGQEYVIIAPVVLFYPSNMLDTEFESGLTPIVIVAHGNSVSGAWSNPNIFTITRAGQALTFDAAKQYIASSKSVPEYKSTSFKDLESLADGDCDYIFGKHNFPGTGLVYTGIKRGGPDGPAVYCLRGKNMSFAELGVEVGRLQARAVLLACRNPALK